MVDNCDINEFIGADPALIKWKVVRGDTASITVQFYQTDETTFFDTTGWTYIATAYEAKTGSSYSLNVTPNSGYVSITATPATTAQWGVGERTGELYFDLQITIDDETVWTPIIGTIFVIGDVTGV